MSHAWQVFVSHAFAGDSRQHIVWVTSAVTLGAWLAIRLLCDLAAWAVRPLRLYVAGRWCWLHVGLRPMWTGCMVELPDGTRGVVAGIYRAYGGHPRRVLIEETNRYSAPQAIVARASDCTRVPRKGFLYVARSLRDAIRSEVGR